MNRFFLIFLFVFVQLGSSVMRGAEKVESKQTPTPTATTTRDAFLAFAFEKAKTYTDKAELAVSKAVDAVSKEIPEALHEFLVWRAWLHGLKGISPFVLLIGAGLLVWNQYPKWEMDYHDCLIKGNPMNVILTVGGFIGLFVGLVACITSGLSNLMSFIQVLVAPRVYVIEQVMHLFGK